MFRKNASKGTVVFSIRPAKPAKKVSLSASFNEWKPADCRKQKDGTYALTVKLPPGTYEYKFLVDDEWQVDPDNPAWKANPFGTFNSVARIEK